MKAMEQMSGFLYSSFDLSLHGLRTLARSIYHSITGDASQAAPCPGKPFPKVERQRSVCRVRREENPGGGDAAGWCLESSDFDSAGAQAVGTDSQRQAQLFSTTWIA